MGFDILEGLRRMITLPAAANSWDDIFSSKDPAIHAAVVAVSTTIHDILADAITSGVKLLITTGETDLDKAQMFLAQQIHNALSGVNPVLEATLTAVVQAQLKSMEQLGEAQVVAFSNALLLELGKALHTA